ncbi:MAG: hypothetical protein DRJ69_03755 [Thermoprotei archaeon]|nr:MAG: hypothetical protein DRJ69_03755 [Thermoprotei archaeon]
MPKLLVQNFKSIKEAELDCARVNVIIGEPNTGKSNLLEAIGLLSLTYYAEGYEDVKTFVRHVKLADLFHENNVNQPIHV